MGLTNLQQWPAMIAVSHRGSIAGSIGLVVHPAVSRYVTAVTFSLHHIWTNILYTHTSICRTLHLTALTECPHQERRHHRLRPTGPHTHNEVFKNYPRFFTLPLELDAMWNLIEKKEQKDMRDSGQKSSWRHKCWKRPILWICSGAESVWTSFWILQRAGSRKIECSFIQLTNICFVSQGESRRQSNIDVWTFSHRRQVTVVIRCRQTNKKTAYYRTERVEQIDPTL